MEPWAHLQVFKFIELFILQTDRNVFGNLESLVVTGAQTQKAGVRDRERGVGNAIASRRTPGDEKEEQVSSRVGVGEDAERDIQCIVKVAKNRMKAPAGAPAAACEYAWVHLVKTVLDKQVERLL